MEKGNIQPTNATKIIKMDAKTKELKNLTTQVSKNLYMANIQPEIMMV